MNDKANRSDDYFAYQVRRFQTLMEEVVQCCETRAAHLSKKFRLPDAELRCLMLFRDDKYLTVKGIALKMDVAKSRVTKIIAGLLEKGLVARIDDPADGRIKLISLTPKGRAMCDEIAAFIATLHEMILQELDPEDRKQVLMVLERLRASMEAVKQRMF
uniref:MarR family transcriptional regulator n=1 Tax=Desulfacinum infernum TaxID=35837 RepID=A0A832EIH5_9BACT